MSSIAASTVLMLAGSAHGFVVQQFAIQPDQTISPNAGAFHNYSGYLTQINLVTVPRSTWITYDSLYLSSSWLAADRWGGDGQFFGSLPGGPGPDPMVPEWNADTGVQSGGGPFDFNYSFNPAYIEGGPTGYTWGAGASGGFEATSAVSPINGIAKDGIFFGQFVFLDAAATGLVGADLAVTIDGVVRSVPLDGSIGDAGYRIEYEPFDAPLGEYHGTRAFVVPAPGLGAMLCISALGSLRRRR